MPFADPIFIEDDLLAIGPLDGDEETFLEVIASRRSIISHLLTSVEVAIDSTTAPTLSGIEDILACLSLESCCPSTQPSPIIASPTQWLLDNLHNPYPPGAVRRSMEKSSELSGRLVNDWFARARQRIGWTRLLRDRFSGCRSAARDAAFRAFVRDDPSSPLDVELYSAFMAVKAHAILVYAPQSPVIQDITSPLLPASRSPSATPSLINSTDSEHSDCDVSRPLRKRKRSHSEFPLEPHSISPSPRKRRLAPPPKCTPSTSHSPSLTIPPIADTPSLSPLLSRKRRLSESNSDEPAVKKHRGPCWAPKKQTVSDPLPLPTQSFDWESWCTEAFALPPSATTNHPVPDALDFDLFNFGAFSAPQSAYISDSSTDMRSESPEQQDTWLDSLFTAPCQTEKDPWESFFNFELPSNSSPMPSLTNSPSPSSPDTQWSLSPPELPCFGLLEPSLFAFPSPSLLKIPTLYPTYGIQIVDNDTPLIS